MLAGDFVNPERLAELFKHTRWVFLTFALAAITSRLDLLCLTAWSGIEQVGIFSAGATLVIVLQLIGTYASVILSPRVMPLWEEGRFFNFYRRFQFATFALCSLLLLVSIPLVEFCAPLLLPAKYLLSKQVIIALLPGALAGLATFPLTLTLLMFQRPRLLFWMDCTGIFLFVICYYLAVPVYGALGAAVVTSCICVFKATLAQIVAWRVAWRSQSFPLVGVSSSSASAVPIGVSGK
jgi:O-antigen/teichoic acid export membrane protein